MIKITNGKHIIEVSNGAYRSIYSKQGFVPYTGLTSEDTSNDSNGIIKGSSTKSSEVNLETIEIAEDPDKVFIDEILEKPIGQWKAVETRRYAELMDIDISGTKNVGEAKEIIKAFLKE